VWKKEKKITEIKIKDKLSISEARKKYNAISPSINLSRSFAQVTSGTSKEDHSSKPSEFKEMRDMMATLLAGQKETQIKLEEQSKKIEEQSKKIEEQTKQIKELKKENIELRTKNTIMAAQLQHKTSEKPEKPEKRKKPSVTSSRESVLSIDASDNSEMELDDDLDENADLVQQFLKNPKKKGKKKKG
jgi:regulator of replication initiation timing